MRVIRGVQFEADAVTIQYVDDSADVRAEGAIYQVHIISISRGANWDEEITKVEDVAGELLVEAVKAWAGSLPFDFASEMAAREA